MGLTAYNLAIKGGMSSRYASQSAKEDAKAISTLVVIGEKGVNVASKQCQIHKALYNVF
jgi:hypothetical protein